MSWNSSVSGQRDSSRRGVSPDDIFEERQDFGVERNELSQRQLLVDIFSNRNLAREGIQEIKSRPDNTESEEELEDSFCEEDFCWFWDDDSKSNDVLVQNNDREVYFHPDYSCGTAAIRGKRQLREGEEHYWEIKMSSAVYGTDMMIGVGSLTVDLNKYSSQFCSIVGKGTDSWGISYFGTLHHNGKTKEYTKKFERGTIIGCHLDLWKGTLSFYKNGKPLGIAFDGLLGKQLYPIVSSTAARTRMKLLCSHRTSFSLQYLCCKEISKNLPSSTEALSSLPLPNGLKKYISWRMDWVFRLNNGSSTSGVVQKKKRIRRTLATEHYLTALTTTGTTSLMTNDNDVIGRRESCGDSKYKAKRDAAVLAR